MYASVAVQTLLAREIADESSRSPQIRSKAVYHLIQLSLLAGGSVAFSLSLLTYFQRFSVMQGLTSNPAVQNAAIAIFPAVLTTQGKLR